MAFIPYHGLVKIGLGDAVFHKHSLLIEPGVISYAVAWHLLCHGLCHVVVVEHIFHLASAKHAIGGAGLARHEAECRYKEQND